MQREKDKRQKQGELILIIILNIDFFFSFSELQTALKVCHMNLTTIGARAASVDFTLELLRKSKWNSEI